MFSYKEDRSNEDDSDGLSDRRSSLSSSESEGYLEQEYKNVITEKSRREDIQKIENEFIERNDLDLAVTGKSCPPLLSKKEKQIIQMKEEKASLEMLKNNGLIQKPVVINQNYALFEILEAEKNQNPNQIDLKAKSDALNSLKAPPPRLLQRERLKPVLTAEEIKDKLDQAKQRKEEQLKIKALGNSISIERKQSGNVSNYNRRQYNQEPEVDQEMHEREKRLKQLRDRLKAKDNTDVPTPRTPRSKELVSEMALFRPKTASNFRPDF